MYQGWEVQGVSPGADFPWLQGRTDHGCHQEVISVGAQASLGTCYDPGLEEARLQTLKAGGLGWNLTTGCVTLGTWLNLSGHPLPHPHPGTSPEPTSSGCCEGPVSPHLSKAWASIWEAHRL